MARASYPMIRAMMSTIVPSSVEPGSFLAELHDLLAYYDNDTDDGDDRKIPEERPVAEGDVYVVGLVDPPFNQVVKVCAVAPVQGHRHVPMICTVDQGGTKKWYDEPAFRLKARMPTERESLHAEELFK